MCSGIEAASVAWGPLNWEAAWLAEIEPFPSAVLAHHYPNVPNHGDMTTLPARILAGEVEAPDLFCGGTPCQAFSVAGLRRSLDDARGNLSLTFCEIADAIDHVRLAGGEPASIVFWENVPGVLSTKDNAFGCFLAQLCGGDEPLHAPGGWPDAGCVSGPTRTAAWRILDAQYFGLAQRRRRVFVVASARSGFDPAAVLLEFDGVRRDSAPSREAGQRVAPTIAGCANGGGANGPGRDVDSVESLQVARCVTTGEGSRLDGESCTFVTHSLRGEGFDASEDGTGRGTLLVPVGVTLHGTDGTQSVASLTDISSSLRARIPSGVENSTTTAVMQPVAYSIMPMNSGKDYKAREVDVAQPLMAGGPVGGNQGGDVIAQPVAYSMITANTGANGLGVSAEIAPTLDRAQPAAVAFHPTQDPISSTEVCHAIGANENATAAVAFDTYNQDLNPHITHALRDGNSEGTPAVLSAMQVRRLTPTECERLQGFPDGYTAIPWRGKPADQCPDGPRYKALGNSWAVPCVRWIGRRIHEFMK